MDAIAWLIVKVALTVGAACGLCAAGVEALRILRDHAEHWEGEVL